MVPAESPVGFAVTVALEEVDELEGVGLVHVPVNFPEPSVVFEVVKQKLMVVEAPFAVILPLKVALEAVTELAAFVVAVGTPTAVKLL